MSSNEDKGGQDMSADLGTSSSDADVEAEGPTWVGEHDGGASIVCRQRAGKGHDEMDLEGGRRMMVSERPPPPLRPGKSRHHIVVLEAIIALPDFAFLHTLNLHSHTRPEEVAVRIKDATIVIACMVPVTPADMAQAPHLGLVAIMATGTSWLDTAYCARRGISVTKCPAANVDAVAEHFLSLYFAARRRTVQIHNTVTRTEQWVEKGTLTRLWAPDPPRGCKHEVLGILGYGTLGRRIEEMARAVGFENVLISERKGCDQVRAGRVAFWHVLQRCTVLCVCLPLDRDTVDLISEVELKAMRHDALVVNVARGGIVNETALARALRDGVIAGAATDVLHTEPAAPGMSPLLPDIHRGEQEVPSLTISAHVAWYTRSTVENYRRHLKEGVEGWVHGILLDAGGLAHQTLLVHDGRVWS